MQLFISYSGIMQFDSTSLFSISLSALAPFSFDIQTIKLAGNKVVITKVSTLDIIPHHS